MEQGSINHWIAKQKKKLKDFPAKHQKSELFILKFTNMF